MVNWRACKSMQRLLHSTALMLKWQTGICVVVCAQVELQNGELARLQQHVEAARDVELAAVKRVRVISLSSFPFLSLIFPFFVAVLDPLSHSAHPFTSYHCPPL